MTSERPAYAIDPQPQSAPAYDDVRNPQPSGLATTAAEAIEQATHTLNLIEYMTHFKPLTDKNAGRLEKAHERVSSAIEWLGEVEANA